ncbi:MAG TPA: MCP four helix bundle domain-containing protein, partial [Trichocoleus sp.]
MSLQSQLAGSFLLMGLIVAAVGGISWQGTTKLSKEVNTLSDTALPSISGLWAINEGQTQIEASELRLLDPDLGTAEQQAAEDRIRAAWQQIDEGFKRYEATSRTEEEEERYQSLVQTWAAWKQNHQQYMDRYEQWAALEEGNASSGQTNTAFKALNAQGQANKASFDAATTDLLDLIEINEAVGKAAAESAKSVAELTQFWSATGAVAGFSSALGLGLVLSIAIAKPLGRKVSGVIKSVVSS